jgi:excinuclease UvrABC nuclease subunit
MAYKFNMVKEIRVARKDFLKELPGGPGVYLFKNRNKEIVYVGRAADLKTRVSSYFKSKPESRRRPMEEFANEIKSIAYKKTANLLEAAVLENNFIKNYLPKYNVKDKDNKSFVYLFFDMAAEFPKPIIIRARSLAKYKTLNSQKNEILGPYQSYRLLKNILLVARKIFPYSTCAPASGRPCFHYQLGLCPGVCVGKIASRDYKRIIKELISFLKKDFPKTNKKAIDDLELMPSKDYSIHYSVHHSVYYNRIEAYDISHFSKGESYGAMVVFENGAAKKSGYRLFKINPTFREKPDVKKSGDVAALKEVLERRLKHKEWPYPSLIVVDGGRQQVNAALRVLRSLKREIMVLGLSKSGRHSQSSSFREKLVFPAGVKKPIRDILASRKTLFQRARNEAHRFAVKAARRSQRLTKFG